VNGNALSRRFPRACSATVFEQWDCFGAARSACSDLPACTRPRVRHLCGARTKSPCTRTRARAHQHAGGSCRWCSIEKADIRVASQGLLGRPRPIAKVCARATTPARSTRSAIYTYGDAQRKAALASKEQYERANQGKRIRADNHGNPGKPEFYLRRGLSPAVASQRIPQATAASAAPACPAGRILAKA